MTENRGDVSITLWDSSADPPEDAGQVYRWNGYAEKDSVHALLQYADTHGERLRRKYLAWVHELGESRIRGKRLIDVLALEDGLSYWWMTLFVEKSPWKSPAIVDAIRLLALEEIVLQEKPDKLRLVSANRNLHEVLRGLCRNLDIAYEWQRVPDKPRPLSLTGIYRALPVPAQALVNLGRYLWERWPLRRAEKSGWFAGDEALFVCSYFTYMVPHQAVAGHFHSRHWEDLHGLMGKLGLSGNWLQHYYPHDAVPNPRVAMEWVQRFNQQRQEEGFHTFLEAYLSWRIVARALKRWLKLNLISWRLSEIKQAFCPQGSNLSLWPLMRGDWYASMRGPVAILNLLWIELFDEALHDLPHQKKGLYLYENQGWERALIHAWRKHGHGQLIAVAHGSNRRFWDLRYFTDSRTVRSSGPRSMPQPDLVALNGKTAIQDYLGLDYPKEAIVECEALRYAYLDALPARQALRRGRGEVTRVLILGDYMPSNTIQMLQLLAAAAPLMSAPVTYTMKPHPNFIISAADYPSLHLEVITDGLGKILHDFDIAYSSNMTSAAVDAYLAGLPVVVMLEETGLNFSPLRGQPGARFASTPEELAEALQTADQGAAAIPDRNEFFFLDPELSRWQRLLGA
jgi:surface carbohydrate biosynthesis protein (TIGR04326 family)